METSSSHETEGWTLWFARPRSNVRVTAALEQHGAYIFMLIAISCYRIVTIRGLLQSNDFTCNVVLYHILIQR